MNYFGLFYCLVAICFVISTLYIIWQSKSKPNFSVLMKIASSLAFTFLGIINLFFVLNNTFSMLFIVLGLVTSIAGDVILAFFNREGFDKENVIKAGMVAFGIAQIFYFIGISLYVGFSIWSLVIGLVIAVLIFFSEKPLKLDYGSTKYFTVGYSFLLGSSLGASLFAFINSGFSVGSMLLFVGFVLFFLSDLVLSFIYFRKETEGLTYLNLALYYAAQIIIASSILFL